MPLDYKSEEISVDTDGTVITPGFDIRNFSVFAVDGNILFRMKDESGWGDWVPLNSGSSFEERFDCSRIHIKSSSGTVAVQYFIKGDR